MKKVLSLLLVFAFSFSVVSAMACPKGQTIVGGVGSYHKGGKCVPKLLTLAAPKAKRKF